MAITLIGGNLVNKGDSGTFEADQSTWGLPLSSGNIFIERSSAQANNGLHSLRAYAVAGETPGVDNAFIRIPVTVTAGKLYQAKTYLRVNGSNPLTDATATTSIVPDSGTVGTQDSPAMGTIEDSWNAIVTQFEATVSGTVYLELTIDFDGDNLLNGGEIWVDDFECYEYEDVPAPTCDLTIDNITKTDETTAGANDGTILVTASGTNGTIQYSKDNGSTWQASNSFAGLADGIYQIKVKDDVCEVGPTAVTIQAGGIVCDLTIDSLSTTHETVLGAEDGRIEVTASSSNGPIQYSKDGGSTYQGSNIFSGLAPGLYNVTLKDASDCIASQIVIINAGAVSYEAAYLLRNPIPFALTATANKTEENYQIYAEVRVEEVADSGTFTKTLAMALPPESDDRVVHLLNAALRGSLTATAPDYNLSAITRLTDRIKFYRVYYGDIYDQDEEPASLTESSPFVVLLGGLSKRGYAAAPDYLGAYLSANKTFLTWYPDEKMVDKGQEDYLNFFVYESGITSLKLQIKAYYDDDTTQTSVDVKTRTSVDTGRLYLIPAGPVNSGATSIDPAKNLIKYELWLTDQTDTIISEVRTYNVDLYPAPNTRYFMYLNSLGAHEVIRATGRHQVQSEIRREVYQKHLPYDYDVLDGEFGMLDPSYQDVYQYSTGYVSKAEAQYLRTMLISEQLYEVTDGERVPLVLETNSIRIRKDRDNRYYVRFEARESYINEGYDRV